MKRTRTTRIASHLAVESSGILVLSLALAGCGGGGGGGAVVPVTPNPQPSISSISPTGGYAGGGGFTLTVEGSSFVKGSTVKWNTFRCTTTFVSATRLTAFVPPSYISTAGEVSITVYNPSPGGGTSSSLTFIVTNPVPTITSLSPATVYAGPWGGVAVNVIGTGFVMVSKAYWNGSERPVYADTITSTHLTLLLSASDTTTVGSGEITVFNPPPEGGTSAPFTLQIVAAPPIDIKTSQLPPTSGGRIYDYTLDIEGEWTPVNYRCSVLDGALPGGLAFDLYHCRIIGTTDPVAADTVFDFKVLATTLPGVYPARTGTKDLSIKVFSGNLPRNDTCANATTISNGRIRASISPYGDVDVYSFQGTAGKQVTIFTFAQYALDSHDLPFAFSSQLDSMLELLDSSCPDPTPNGTNALVFNDDIEDPDTYVRDSRIPPSYDSPSFALPYTGTYYLRVRDFRGDGRPDLIYELGIWGAD